MARKGSLGRTKRYCLYCLSKGKSKEESEIILDNYQMVAIERPYINLWFHGECYRDIKHLPLFLQENKDLWYN
jgi:hypothetical protein